MYAKCLFHFSLKDLKRKARIPVVSISFVSSHVFDVLPLMHPVRNLLHNHLCCRFEKKSLANRCHMHLTGFLNTIISTCANYTC